MWEGRGRGGEGRKGGEGARPRLGPAVTRPTYIKELPETTCQGGILKKKKDFIVR